MATATQPVLENKDVMASYPDDSQHTFESVDTNGVDYPDTDGQPMGETGFHVRATLHLYGALCQYFLKQADVYVASDMFLYYEEGNRYAQKAPDVMVIKGVGKHERRSFKLWEEQAGPCVIFEVTSKSTMEEDMVTKSALYASLGVQEYFLFDPLGEYLIRPLIGFQLTGNAYVRIAPDEKGCMHSQELGLLLKPERDILRIIDSQTNKPVPSLDEAIAQAEQEAQRAEQETQRAEQEAQRAERLAMQLRAMGVEPEM